MMLFYKAWRESRSTFFGGVLLLSLYCAGVIILRENARVQGSGAAYHEYVTAQIFSSTGKALFVLVVILLGPAGLLRERSHHRAVFTLSLPIRRLQFLGAQLGVGLMQIALLALLTAILIQPLSILVHQSYPLNEVLRYSFLRFICGTEIFALSFLLSTVMAGAYTAPIACYFALLLQARTGNWGPLVPYGLNPMRTIDWGRNSQDLSQPFPWIPLALLTLIAISLFAIAARITERQNI
jgi:hypothetical protein